MVCAILAFVKVGLHKPEENPSPIWMDLYYEFIQDSIGNNLHSYTGWKFVYMDEDTIPELFLVGENADMLTIENNNVRRLRFAASEIYVLPIKGIIHPIYGIYDTVWRFDGKTSIAESVLALEYDGESYRVTGQEMDDIHAKLMLDSCCEFHPFDFPLNEGLCRMEYLPQTLKEHQYSLDWWMGWAFSRVAEMQSTCWGMEYDTSYVVLYEWWYLSNYIPPKLISQLGGSTHQMSQKVEKMRKEWRSYSRISPLAKRMKELSDIYHLYDSPSMEERWALTYMYNVHIDSYYANLWSKDTLVVKQTVANEFRPSSVDNKPQWMKDYINYELKFWIDSVKGNESVAFAFIDNDTIPELIVDNGSERGDMTLLSWHNGKVIEMHTYREGFEYIPTSGLCGYLYGARGHYSQYIYTLGKAGIKQIAEKEMWDSGTQSGEAPAAECTFNGKKMMNSQANLIIEKIYDTKGYPIMVNTMPLNMIFIIK